MEFLQTEFNKILRVSEISSIRIFGRHDEFNLYAQMKNGKEHTIYSSKNEQEVWNKYQELISQLNIDIIRL